jgi:hypothetical protein
MDGLAAKLARESGLGTAPAPQSANEYGGLDPREVVDLRFFLTLEELDEATAVRKVKSNEKSQKTMMRTVCAIGAAYAAFVPYLHGTTWSFYWNHKPASALFWGFLLVADIYVALGQPGMMKLNRAANRLNVERRICVSHRGIDITHGKLRQQKQWKDFSFFQETPTIYLLQTNSAMFWTIPKRAIPAGRGDQLEALLKAKLQKR